MNYDKLLGQYFLARSLFIKPIFKKIKYKTHITESKKCYILLSAWQMPIIDNFLLEHKLKKENFLVVELPDAIISTKPQLTVTVLNKINKMLHKQIAVFKRSGVKEFIVIASSLGTVPGTIILNEEKSIKKAILVSPGASLSESFWEGTETQNVRRMYELQNISKNKLSKLWNSVQPSNNMDNFKGKSLIVHLSESDTVVPYKQGINYSRIAKTSGAKVKIIKNKNLGHILTVAKNYIFRNISQ